MSKTHMVVLGVLNERPMYTYEFKQIIEERGYEHWAGIQMRSVYKAMESLVGSGYLYSTRKIHPNTSFVNIYEVNDCGREYLQKLVEKAFYSRVGQVDIWLAIAFMFATTREFALTALRKRRELLLEERVQDLYWKEQIEKEETFIPSNYQGLIKMGYEVSFLLEKRLNEWIANLEQGSDKGFFADEREGYICKQN
ncbi:MAG: PadR family transcriptional regulator [Candidatus Cloacimonetes bacterium]|nr:PadR family transcriptional regulator [Candidatus Cloacimonadota bacterium]